MTVDAHLTHLAIRWLHVAAMATAFGGASLVLILAVRAGRGALADALLLQIATGYEWVFWAAAGVLAMTGIGNLGVFGAQLPVVRTDWGTTLVTKVIVVILLVTLSLPRTLVVARFVAGRSANGLVSSTLQAVYGGTVAAFALILGLAVWLAHG